jgi:hypothetical protein
VTEKRNKGGKSSHFEYATQWLHSNRCDWSGQTTTYLIPRLGCVSKPGKIGKLGRTLRQFVAMASRGPELPILTMSEFLTAVVLERTVGLPVWL